MVLHFVIDEKVTDQIIENFSSVDKDCYFLIFTSSEEGEYNYISKRAKNVMRFNSQKEDINGVMETLKPSVVFIHAFHIEFAYAILKIKAKIKIAWYAWGFDVYGLPRIKPSTYGPLTNKYLLNNNVNLRFGRLILKYGLLRKTFFFLKKEEDRYTIIFKALRKVNYFVSYIEEDFSRFSKYYSNKLIFVYCPFSNINQYLGGSKTIFLKKNASNLLVGNSNSFESNHLDAFQIITKHHDVKMKSKIYVPLSYSNDNKYKDCVLKKGRDLFGDSFSPLLSFIDRVEYIEILRSCSTGIFYHLRQQAMGNIIAMLYLGCRVYLSSNNPAYSFFIKNNIKVFNLETEYPIFKNTILELSDINHNRLVLDSLFNEEKVFNDIKNLVSIIS
ncbi:TDP-N-acetylfucosamine:lipid II N-acetylfucosaminyltransferase [Winogradskyella sp. UBA3174]|uniref:TDP-N-acetylfucosamine:lipid II N-acetylfucosaminyltransferase n=1 Tax=Winogradskyella sp. UBA3174 TaxID=1947785 RepID=UPI0025EF7723|nr:TDP-N-acetylfucosamine:lipid II N-acetylfucosaminyltransferase [Winogradskyella sp. UBA3174]|tara:strand:+ start:67561 stop:68721 length:1161 start_codon:yes stop_codon:yes gene_type:complete